MKIMNLYQASFLKSVRQFPHNIALYTEDNSDLVNSAPSTTFTYQALFNLSQRWGNCITHLNKGQGAVAIYGGRQWQMYAGILATLSTNTAYVPLNNKQPANRSNKVLSQINCKVLLVAEKEDPTALLHLTKLALVVIYLGEDDPKWLTNNSHHNCVKIEEINVGVSVSPSLKDEKRSITTKLIEAESKLKTANRYAYILFTSGSTGTPKGIAVSHANIVNHLTRLDELLQLKATDKVSQFFELSFDLSVHDMFSCWSKGAALYVIPSEQLMCPFAFIKQHTLTVFSTVASSLSFMDKLSLLQPQQLPHLRVSCFGGEKLLTSQALSWQQCAHNSRVLNIYGPTECTITATYYELSNNHSITSASVPIGKALPGLSAILINDNKKVSTINTLAELYLAGDQLVDGYLQDTAKTEQAFITLKLSNEETTKRYYRTGDIAYYDEQQNIVFHGRNDHQFKVSGHRVEAAEIEAAIMNFSTNISWCVVSAQTKIMGNTTIIAFIENAEELSLNTHANGSEQQIKSALRTHCLQHLPAYMVPDEFILCPYLPRNLSGKVDIKALLQNSKKQRLHAKNINYKISTNEATPC
jgi:amino acid adenylation domain-containing protein